MRLRIIVPIGGWDFPFVEKERGLSERDIDLIGEAQKKLEKLGAFNKESCMVYKTSDLEDAKDFKTKAEKILKELDEKTDCDFAECIISIRTQPQCPKCGNLGRLSDLYCNQCGTELTPSKYIDLPKD